MDNNEFGDDDGLRQARSRRRFQTGLLIFLLLFFMDAKTPQETQSRGRRVAQARTIASNQDTTTTVHRLAEKLDEYVPHGSPYALRDISSIKGDWQRSDGDGFRTVVPAMDKNVGEGNGSKNRPDLRNETIAPQKTGTVTFKQSRMTASLVKDEDNSEVSTVHGTLNLGSVVTQTIPDVLFEGLFFHKYGHLSAVIGASGDALRVVWPSDPAAPAAAAAAAAATTATNPAAAGGDAAAQGSAVGPALGGGAVGSGRLAVGSANANDTVAPDDGEGHAAALVGEADDPQAGDGAAATEAVVGGGDGGDGGDGSIRETPREEGIGGGEGGVAEGLAEEAGGGGGGGDVRERRRSLLDDVTHLKVGGGSSAGRGSGLEGVGWGAGATERASAAAVAGGEGMAGGGGWLWSDKPEQREEGADGEGRSQRRRAGDGDGGDDQPRRTPDSRSLASSSRHLSDQPVKADQALEESPEAAGGAEADVVELDASVTGDAKDDGSTAAAAAMPNADGDEEAEEEVDAGATVAGDAEGPGEAEDGAEGQSPLKREFPAMVLPEAAVVTAGQDSGPLPSQWYNPRKEYGEGCLFLLTLQTVEDDEDEDEDAAGGDGVVDGGDGEAADARIRMADLMRGELVGVNCDFSAVIEVQLSSSNVVRTDQSQAISYTVLFTMVCLLQMCLLCCRVGLMLAQRRYGRNFMVPRRFQPPKFDYHRPIPPELTAQTGTETASGQHSEETRDLEAGNCLECAICYAAVDSALEDYMLTPCDHVFHQGCLTRWMNIKMECPTCRRELPPQLERS